MTYNQGDILLNKYRIEALIGQGAFAEVYHATHLALNAPRALKILRRDAPGVGSTEYADFHARFQLEAQLGAKLDHPNIIRVYDFEQDRKTLILVMEYAEGGNLAGRIQRAREKDLPIPIEEALQIGVDVAQGLSALHAMDAIHRDLKPSNKVTFFSTKKAMLKWLTWAWRRFRGVRPCARSSASRVRTQARLAT